jgi:hypothetical protein
MVKSRALQVAERLAREEPGIEFKGGVQKGSRHTPCVMVKSRALQVAERLAREEPGIEVKGGG